MKVDLFDYVLPEERIAQRPLPDRAASRLLVLDRRDGTRLHARFRDLAAHLPAGALLVFNDTAVIPARLVGRKEDTGGRVEVFLLERLDAPFDPLRPGSADAEPGSAPAWGCWRALVQASKRVRPGTRVRLGDEGRQEEAARAPFAEVLAEAGEGAWEIALHGDGPLDAALSRLGHVPLPPYIRREADADDLSRYQTVFAKHPGAVAAPTAGLHFTPEVLARLRDAGHETAHVTLHVGAGTFLPVRVEDVAEHRMHEERFDVPAETAEAVRRARAEGRPVVAVGTTSLRALESAAASDGSLASGHGSTRLFITPGYRFGVVDALFTNFHAPRSTLLMLVAAFAGLDAIRDAYAEALREGYRFLSYGDAMLVK